MSHDFYAKSSKHNGDQITVKAHLEQVARYAEAFGKDAELSWQAKLAGLMHDFGKYSDVFQSVLKGLRTGVDHAVCGAAVLYQALNKPKDSRSSIIEAVNGHHDGLMGYPILYPLLSESLRGSNKVSVNDGKTAALCGMTEYQSAVQRFRSDFPDFRLDLPKAEQFDGNLESMLYTRMLFSCLVDADYSVSAWEEDNTYFDRTNGEILDAAESLRRLYEYREYIKQTSKSACALNVIRDQLFERCGQSGDNEKSGLFTLTAPTGTGKTLALLHFALRHCIAQDKKRIIIVLPFLTLAEQNAAVYETILPSVLVDHSQRSQGEEMRDFSAKWNVPFLITTSVRFFETLFASRPGDCRKLHNLANSVVVFDEAQSLPLELTEVTLRAVKELCRRYRMTMVFSTATQPKFDALRGLEWKPKEILPGNELLYQQLKRVEPEWRLTDTTPLTNIAAEMMEQDSVCGVFNLRRHARLVFEQLYNQDPESAFLITTDLCPAHRTEVIMLVRRRLQSGLPCRVAATQCIEAGVDLDFNVLYRALAPLESIIQAAGRCNRNGNHMGKLVVFEPDDRKYPDRLYENAAKQVKQMVMGKGIDIHDPADIDRYYEKLFTRAEQEQNPKLIKAINDRNYSETDCEYRLIRDNGEKLIVPYSKQIELYNTLSREMKNPGITPKLMKQAAPLTITVYRNDDIETYAEQVMTRPKLGHQSIPSGYWILREQYRELYTDGGGLQLPLSQKEEKINKITYIY